MTPKILHPKKVICQKRLQDSSIEENKLQYVTLFLPLTFLSANFSHILPLSLFWYPYAIWRLKNENGKHCGTIFFVCVKITFSAVGLTRQYCS
jgi:hypothetical protein